MLQAPTTPTAPSHHTNQSRPGFDGVADVGTRAAPCAHCTMACSNKVAKNSATPVLTEQANELLAEARAALSCACGIGARDARRLALADKTDNTTTATNDASHRPNNDESSNEVSERERGVAPVSTPSLVSLSSEVVETLLERSRLNSTYAAMRKNDDLIRDGTYDGHT